MAKGVAAKILMQRFLKGKGDDEATERPGEPDSEEMELPKKKKKGN